MVAKQLGEPVGTFCACAPALFRSTELLLYAYCFTYYLYLYDVSFQPNDQSSTKLATLDIDGPLFSNNVRSWGGEERAGDL